VQGGALRASPEAADALERRLEVSRRRHAPEGLLWWLQMEPIRHKVPSSGQGQLRVGPTSRPWGRAPPASTSTFTHSRPPTSSTSPGTERTTRNALL
jgi:hypothetical protein